MTADELVSSLLTLSATEPLCMLDSGGVSNLGSHLLIAGIDPVETFEINYPNVDETLSFLEDKLSGDLASIFTISYDFGIKLLNIQAVGRPPASHEPDVFLARFDVLIVHDYDTGKSFLVGNSANFSTISEKLRSNMIDPGFEISDECPELSSDFTRDRYIAAVEKIKELIRSGDTYQTNLTQQITARLPPGLSPQTVFARLRRDHPAPFAAFIQRRDSTVISASPERFFKVEKCSSLRVSEGETCAEEKIRAAHTPDFAQTRASDALRITTSPIKGTRKRGTTRDEDDRLKNELLSSDKDRAENTMIVDLLRNDLGRVCEYGSVEVENLCSLETHPTLFHLVSTVSGKLRREVKFSDILRATFPCGSITGAPKISTMSIIDKIEPVERGLSMGAIGCYIPGNESKAQSPKSKAGSKSETLDLGPWTLDPTGPWTLDYRLEMSVAIRTMVIREQTATFNVGGGIVIDSDPESEYEETLTKAKALLIAIGAPGGSLFLQQS